MDAHLFMLLFHLKMPLKGHESSQIRCQIIKQYCKYLSLKYQLYSLKRGGTTCHEVELRNEH